MLAFTTGSANHRRRPIRYAILLVPLLALFALACNGGGEAQPTATAEPDATATTLSPSPTPAVQRPDPASLLSPGYVLDQALEVSLDGSEVGQIAILSHTVREVLATGDPASASVPAREDCPTLPEQEFDPGACVFRAEVFTYDPGSAWTRKFLSPEPAPGSGETEKDVPYGHRGGIQGMSDAQTFALDTRGEALVLTFSYCTGIGSGCGDYHEVVSMQRGEFEIAYSAWKAQLTIRPMSAIFDNPAYFNDEPFCCPGGRYLDTLGLDSATAEVAVIESQLLLCTEGAYVPIDVPPPGELAVRCDTGVPGTTYQISDETVFEPASLDGLQGLREGDRVRIEYVIDQCPEGVFDCFWQLLAATKVTALDP